jgi:pimeloyl-ACP methyl ester carboxylesterase
MESFGEDVAAVVDHLGLDRVVLVGHSLGGNVTVEAALRLPGRVRGLVWVSSFRSLDSIPSPAEVEVWFAPFNVDFRAAMDDLIRRNFGPNADPALVEAVTTTARGADQTRVMSLLKSEFNHQHTVVEALSQVQAPIFAINPDFKPNDESSFARHGVELRVVPGVGHFVMMEDPDAFNTELANILTRLH